MTRRRCLATAVAVAVALLAALAVLQRNARPPSTAGAPEAKPVIWRDPGAVHVLDLVEGPGGRARAPRPPFWFLAELSEGRSPKLRVRDAGGREWVVKWGPEAKAECFAVRLAWAVGYFAMPTYLIRSGTIEGIGGAERPGKYVDAGGRFTDGRFELWESRLRRGPGWNWEHNPFSGTRELAGLKIVMMLVSNWDAKDAREGSDDSNTAIIDASGRREERYIVSDWGGSMGEWGHPFFHRDSWNCSAYTRQTADFVRSVREGRVVWGFAGTHDLTSNIAVEDVAWITGYLERIRDTQLGAALEACGATREEIECYTGALRARIEQLRRVAGARHSG